MCTGTALNLDLLQSVEVDASCTALAHGTMFLMCFRAWHDGRVERAHEPLPVPAEKSSASLDILATFAVSIRQFVPVKEERDGGPTDSSDCPWQHLKVALASSLQGVKGKIDRYGDDPPPPLPRPRTPLAILTTDPRGALQELYQMSLERFCKAPYA